MKPGWDALKKKMSNGTATTRTTRSRISSPHPGSNGHGPLEPSKNAANDGGKTALDLWLEPKVQSRPSYEDHGLARHGVLENMRSLDDLPRSAVQKRKEGGGTHPVRKIILKTSSSARPASSSPAPATPTMATHAAAAREARRETREGVQQHDKNNVQKQEPQEDKPMSDVFKDASPAVTQSNTSSPAAVAAPDATALAAEKSARRALPGGRTAEDDAYEPKAGASSRAGSTTTRTPLPGPRRSLPRASTSRRTSVAGEPQQSDSSTPAPAPFTPGNAPLTQSQSHSQSTPHQTSDKHNIDRIVEAAVDDALNHHRYPTAWALRNLYDERAPDPGFLELIESVFTQTAEPEALKEFAGLLHAAKKEGKRKNQAWYYYGSTLPFPSAKPSPWASKITLDLSIVHEPVAPVASEPPKKQQPQAAAPPAAEPQETPSRRKRRSRKHRHSTDAMDIDDNGVPATPGSRRRAASDSSGLSELEQSPSLPSPTPIARRDARLEAGARALTAGAAADETAPNDLRPIQRRSGAAHQAVSADTSQPTSPSAPAGSTRDSTTTSNNMPGRVSPPVFPVVSKGKGAKGKGKGKGKAPAITPSEEDDDDDAAVQARRQDARLLTADNTSRVESSVRASAPAGSSKKIKVAKQPPAQAPLSGTETPVASARPRKTRNSVIGTAGPGSSRVTRSGKRPIDEVEGTASSPAASTFLGDAASGSNSRAATPSLKPAAKKQRRNGPRVKSSPVKKKGGTAAGLPRPSGDVSSIGFINGTDENDENCSACGGVGDLVCCEDCPRSFHFDCVDLDVNDDLPDEWYCRICTTRKNPPTIVGPRGGFSSLINQLDRVNNQSFKLPQDIQNYFEGVRAGPEGDYESFDPNAPTVPPKPRRRGVVDEGPDFFPVRDAEDKAVLCHNCQRPTSDDRAIIPCSVCGLHWHLDCVTPPLAIPPVLRTWVCPAHPGDLLENQPGGLGPAHKHRKIKGAPVIEPEFSRGMKNNGFIDIYDDHPAEDDAGWKHTDSFGRVHRVPESGVILDFIDAVHKDVRAGGAGDKPRTAPTQAAQLTVAPAKETLRTAPQSTQQHLNQRPVQEAQAALNLATLADGGPSAGLDMLTDALLVNADQSVLSLMARGSADNIASGSLTNLDAQSLRAMKAQLAALTLAVNARLDGQDGPESANEAAMQRIHTPLPTGSTSPTSSKGIKVDSAKNDVAEGDLPTPATIAADTADMINGMMEKSSPANDSAMDLD